MIPWEISENFYTVMVIIVFFDNFWGKPVTFLAPNFTCFTNNAFCSHSFDYACLRRLRYIVMKRFKIMEKPLVFKNIVETAGEGGCIRSIPHTPLRCIITKDGLKLKRYVLN